MLTHFPSAEKARSRSVWTARIGRVIGVRRTLAIVAMLLALHATLAYSQINTATLSGTVKDTSGATIAEASVTVVQSATGTARAAQTNAAGFFNVPFLQPGDYTVRISKNGFEGVSEQVTLQVNQIASLNFSMKVGQTSESITVSSEELQLQTETSSLGTVIGTQDISNLPLNGRQFIQLLQLAPGTAPVSVSQTAVPDLGSSGSNITPAINGGTGRSNLFYVDGLYATDPFFSSLSVSPSVDAIQEFQEQTHTDQAQFGGATGGTVNLVTKGGTNQFHGSAYEYFRNDAIAARPAFYSGKIATYRQNQFGGSASGPIVHNKVFFFGYYDGYRQLDQSASYAQVPTSAQLTGDFSASPHTIYDPATYDAATNSAQAFPGNKIPGNRIDPNMRTVLKAFIPAPNTDCSAIWTGCNAFNGASAPTNQDQWSIRGDYNAGAKDLLYGRYTHSKNTYTGPSAIVKNPWVTGMEGTNAGATWVHTFSPSLVSQITAGYNGVTHPQDQPQPDAAQVFQNAGFEAGFTDTPGAIKVPKIPGQHVNGYFDLNGGWGPIGPQHLYQISGSVNKQSGAHALNLGAAYYHTWMYTNWAENDESYSQTATWNPATQDGGDALASMLLSLPNSANRQLGNSGVNLKMTVMSAYAQDTWKVRPRLTVNYGVRWDNTVPTGEADNMFSGFDSHTGTWYVAKNNKFNPSPMPSDVVVLDRNTLTKPDYANFSPRLGFTWMATPNTVVSAGAGVNFDNWSGAEQAAQNARGAWPDGASQGVSNQNQAGLTAGSTAENPFVGTTTAFPTDPLGGNTGGTFLDTRWKDAYSWQWNLAVQRQFGSIGTVKGSYVGSATSRSPVRVPSNVSRVLGPTWDKPFSGMGWFAEIQSIGHMSYNAFQAQYQKSAKALTINSAFTWSKNINLGCADFWEGCNIQDPYHMRSNRAVDSVDLPIVLTASAVYELPFGKGKTLAGSGAAAQILGGWKVNGLFSHRSGTPFTPGVNNDLSNAHTMSIRPNASGSTKGPKTRAEWFNVDAFSQPAQYTYGNAGRNSLRGPGYTNMDFSVFREFRFAERYSVDLRTEIFNIFNHVNLGNPDSTFGDSNGNFGKISSASGAQRRFQFAGTFRF